MQKMTRNQSKFENIIYQGLKENKKFQENPGNIFNPLFDSIADAVLK